MQWPQLQLHKCLAETITNLYAKVPNCQWRRLAGRRGNFHAAQCQEEVPTHLGPPFGPLARIRWQFCANFLRLLFVYETSHVSDETRSLARSFALFGGRWTDSWLSGRAITLFFRCCCCFILRRLSLESRIQQLANVTKAAKTFHDLSRPFQSDCWFGNLLF